MSGQAWVSVAAYLVLLGVMVLGGVIVGEWWA